MNPNNLIRAILMAALFGAAVIVLGGILTRLGSNAGSAVKSVV